MLAVRGIFTGELHKTMQNIRTIGALLGSGAIILALAGCGNNGADSTTADAANAASNGAGQVGNTVAGNLGDTANAAVKGANAVGNTVAGAGAAVVNGAANVGKAASNAAVGAGAAASNAAAGVGTAASNATLTPQIKTALGGNKALNGSNINVDTNQATKTVTLTGTVTSPDQKTVAETVAKQKATGFKVVDSLTVQAK